MEVARALGYLPVSCFVGPEFDTVQLTGSYQPVIVDGWYSHVETSLSGMRRVQRRYLAELDDGSSKWVRETLFTVTWSARSFDDVATCQVHGVEYGTLVVTVLEDDRAAADVRVWACGAEGRSGTDGVVVLEPVPAGSPCRLLASRVSADVVCHASEDVTVPTHGRVSLEVELECGDIAQAELPWALMPSSDNSAAHDLAEELDLLVRLDRDDMDETGRWIVDTLIDRRKGVMESRREHAARMKELNDQFEKVQALGDRLDAARSDHERETIGAELDRERLRYQELAEEARAEP